MSTTLEKAAFLIAIVFWCAISFWAGRAAQRNDMRKEAVKAGVAEWIADPQTGESRFQYKQLTEKP